MEGAVVCRRQGHKTRGLLTLRHTHTHTYTSA